MVSSTGSTWVIPGARDYPDSYIAEEIRSIALAAMTSGTNVNICASEKSTPNIIWAIELERE